MAEQAQHDLDEALPALAEAMKVYKLKSLPRNEITTALYF